VVGAGAAIRLLDHLVGEGTARSRPAPCLGIRISLASTCRTQGPWETRWRAVAARLAKHVGVFQASLGT
jgi:hypothetical protein